MKKSLLAFCLTIAGASVFAQSPRLTLFEEFTGENCAPCAATNPGLNTILSAPTNTPKVVAIKWEVPIPSAPSATWSLYKTNQAEIDWRYRSTTAGGYGYPSQWTPTNAVTSGINAAPTGLFDGQHQWTFGATSDHPFYVSNAVISAAQSQTAAFSITMTRAWDPAYSSVNLTVNIVATANFSATGTLVFRTVMVEKEIHFPNAPGTNGEKEFHDVAIKSFPNIQNGTPMASSWTIGQTQTFTMNCPLPSYVRDKSQVAFVGFIQDDGNRRVAQAGRTGTDGIPNDAKAAATDVPLFLCTNSVIPQAVVLNNGINAITDLTIAATVDGSPQPPFIWTGNLAAGATSSIALNPVTGLSAGSHTIAYNITGVSGTDNNLINNISSKKFFVNTTFFNPPIVQGFTPAAFPPPNWATYNTYNGASFIKTTACGGFGLSPESAKLDLYASVPDGGVNDLIMPPLTFTAATNPTLSFDVAYAQWTNNENDKLEISISNNCGATWMSVFMKSGATLQTTSGGVAAAFTPNAAQWRKETVALTGVTTGDYLIKFTVTSDYGNNLYLDNINLAQCLVQNLSVASTESLICPGETVTLTASGANSYSWSSGASLPSIVITPSSNTTYTINSMDPGTCSTYSAVFTQMVGVEQTISISSATNQICKGSTATLTAAGANNFSWSTGGSAPSITVNPQVNTTYTATSTDPDACDVFTAVFSLSVKDCNVGIDKNAVDGIPQLFPNPNNGAFVISDISDGSKIVIHNTLGQIVYESELAPGENLVTTTLAKGLYQYSITRNSEQQLSGKMIIQ